MKRLSGIFLRGLAAILPIAVTLYLLYWVGSSAEAVLGGLLQRVLPGEWYLPGLGLVAGVLLIFVLGVLLKAYLVQQLWRLVELAMQRIPLVSTIYGAAQDLMTFFSPRRQEDMGQVVTVPFGDSGYRLLGIVTRQSTADLPPALASLGLITVYIPFGYQIGGHTLLVPPSAVQPVDMTVEQAMRFILTAGISAARPGELEPKAGAAPDLAATGNAPGRTL